MLASEGLYIGGDARHPDALVPLWSSGGKVFSLKIDEALDTSRFLPEFTVRGPYLPNVAAKGDKP